MEQFNQDSQNNEAGKWELKEEFNKERTIALIREWLEAMEGNRDMRVEIKGKECLIPNRAFEVGHFTAEYEWKGGEFELELELKWKESDAPGTRQ